jgi:hypothetical protein
MINGPHLLDLALVPLIHFDELALEALKVGLVRVQGSADEKEGDDRNYALPPHASPVETRARSGPR